MTSVLRINIRAEFETMADLPIRIVILFLNLPMTLSFYLSNNHSSAMQDSIEWSGN